ncbi:MAG TPA: XRE family transcriptional regulator [Actinokineospora sp.]|jgi:hypothetical protein|nr:XRE family transcriptional regulator [Actinokineospora sp.]
MTLGEADIANCGLDEILATGPFPVALRAAIQHSGLSLDRIRHRLELHGIKISIAALSHWQSGRSRPERADSMVALHVIEDVLGLDRGALVGLLGAPRRRGRSRPEPLPPTALWPDGHQPTALLDRLDARPDDGLARISHHDSVRFGPDRREEGMRARQLLRATGSGVSRLVITRRAESPGPVPPIVRGIAHCRTGRWEYDAVDGFLVAELLFDRVLDIGDLIMIEFEVVDPSATPSHDFERKLSHPLREYLMDVSFDPAAAPRQCTYFAQSTVDSDLDQVRTVQPDASGSVQLAFLDVPAGIRGLRWDWD